MSEKTIGYARSALLHYAALCGHEIPLIVPEYEITVLIRDLLLALNSSQVRAAIQALELALAETEN